MTAITRFSLRFPGLTLSLLLLASALALAGLPQLSTDVGYRAFLGNDHRAVRELDAFLERFGAGLGMAAVWSCRDSSHCESVFDPEALAMAHEIGAALESAPGVQRVLTPATVPLAVPGMFGPRLRRFTEDGVPVRDRQALAVYAVRDPSWVGQLVSEDGRVGAILIELESSGSEVAVEAYRSLTSALRPHENRGVRFHLVGGPVEFVVAGAELEAATLRMVPAMVILVGLILLLMLGSPGAAVAVLVSVGVAVLWTMGLLGWLSAFDWAQNSLTQTLPPLVLVIGVCDGIHLVARYASRATTPATRNSQQREHLLEEVAVDVGRPCLLTSLTTAAGFLSFAGADLASFVRFGALAAAGVLSALLLSFTLLPLLLRHVEPSGLRIRRTSVRWDDWLTRLVGWSERRSGRVLAVAFLLAVVSGVGLSRLRIDASFEDLYGESSPVVRWAHFVGEHLRRPDSLEIELQPPKGEALESPQTLAVIGRAGDELAQLDGLGPARSLLGPLGWARRLRHGDDPAYQRPAETTRENRAVLTRLERASIEAGGDGLSPWLNRDARRLRISIEAEKPPQDELRRIMQRVQRLLEGELPPGWSGTATGPLAVVHEMIDDLRAAQLESFATAAAAVLLLVALFFRSLTWAALALVPTVLPVVVTLGLMGLAGLSLDVGSAMVAAVVLGIAIDDSIHLLEQFRRRRRAGAPPGTAMRDAVRHVGRALVTTSVALALGFSALALSPWQSVASFGLVSAVAILAALAATLWVLPALVFAATRGGRFSAG